MRTLFFFLLFNTCLFASEYKFEGYYKYPDGEGRINIFAPYLPYKPNVLVLANEHETKIIEKVSRYWPESYISTSHKQKSHFDLIWIDLQGTELSHFKTLDPFLNSCKVIYTTTQSGNDSSIKNLLFSKDFILLSHWYWENQSGHAIFIKRDFFDACMSVANYSEHINQPLSFKVDQIERYFQKIPQNKVSSQMDGIDFIYVINLDERPEKFNLTLKALQPFGITPFRFSAVSGWKLTPSDVNSLGVTFHNIIDPFIVSTFKHSKDKEYLLYHAVDQHPCFCFGITRGQIGIILSHLSILQDGYDSGYQSIWVMEDDIEVVQDPNQLSVLIKELYSLDSNWDVLFTDVDTKDKKGNYVPCRSLAFRANYPMQPLTSYLNHFYPISAKLSRTGMRFGAYSMIVSRSGMKKILDFYKIYGIYLPYDMDFWLNLDLNLYTTNFDVVSTIPDAITDNATDNHHH